MDQQSGRELMRRIVPLLELLLFLKGQDGKIGELCIRIRDDACEQDLQVLRHPLHPAMLKYISDVLDRDRKALRRFGHRERDVEPGCAVVNIDMSRSQT